MLFRDGAACYFVLFWQTLICLEFYCKCSLNAEQWRSRAEVPCSAFRSIHPLEDTGLSTEAFAVPLSSSMFIVKMLSALATGEITWALKMLEVGVSLEHWGIWIRDALPEHTSPRSPHLPVLSQSNFPKIQKVGMGEEVFLSGPGRACTDGLCRPRKACWCVYVCRNQARYLKNPTCDVPHW